MIQYEYLKIGCDLWFDDYGKAGWELVSVYDGWAYFKRVLQVETDVAKEEEGTPSIDRAVYGTDITD